MNDDTQCPYVRHREDEHFNCVLAPGHKGAHQDVFGSTEGPWGLDEWTETETT